MDEGSLFAGSRVTYPSPPLTSTSCVLCDGHSLSGGALSTVLTRSPSPSTWTQRTQSGDWRPRYSPYQYAVSTHHGPGRADQDTTGSPRLFPITSSPDSPERSRGMDRSSIDRLLPLPLRPSSEWHQASATVQCHWSELEQKAYALGFQHGLDVHQMSSAHKYLASSERPRPGGTRADRLGQEHSGTLTPTLPPIRSQSDPTHDAIRPAIPITLLVSVTPRPGKPDDILEDKRVGTHQSSLDPGKELRDILDGDHFLPSSTFAPSISTDLPLDNRSEPLMHASVRAESHGDPPDSYSDVGPSSKPWPLPNTRLAISCYPCRERKLRCDGKAPCGPCVKKRNEHHCEYATEVRRRGKTQKGRRTREKPLRGRGPQVWEWVKE